MSDIIRVAPDTIEAAIREVLAAREVPEDDAAATARGLVAANLRGVDTHGLACLPDYVTCLDGNRIKARPDMRAERRLPWAATLDADNGLGPPTLPRRRHGNSASARRPCAAATISAPRACTRRWLRSRIASGSCAPTHRP